MNSTKSVPKTLENLNSLKVAELRKYLRDNGQLTSGLKADLLLRCRFLIENPDSSSNVEPENTLVIASTSQNCPDVNVERLKEMRLVVLGSRIYANCLHLTLSNCSTTLWLKPESMNTPRSVKLGTKNSSHINSW